MVFTYSACLQSVTRAWQTPANAIMTKEWIYIGLYSFFGHYCIGRWLSRSSYAAQHNMKMKLVGTRGILQNGTEVRRLTGQPKLTAIVQSRRPTLFGHIVRMDDNATLAPEDWRIHASHGSAHIIPGAPKKYPFNDCANFSRTIKLWHKILYSG